MRRFGLLGRSLAHSFSKQYFTDKFAREGIEARYDNFEVDTAEAIKGLVAEYPNLSGLNVTIPYKEAVMASLDHVDPTAKAIGAVNTVVVRDGETTGYNTDMEGFRTSIKPFLAHRMERALILGTGGASKAVKYVFDQLGIETLKVSRNPRGEGEIAYGEVNENAVAFHRIIVNTTPLGTWPDIGSKPDLPYAALTPGHLLFDLVYRPAETAFLREGRKAGATTVNGLDMLRIQAERSWDLWNS